MFGKPIKVTDGVYQMRAIGARVTVLADGGDLILVDAGLRGSSRGILRGLRHLGWSGKQLGRVLVTHAHPDHSGGLAELVATTDAAVAAHGLEADIIEGAPAPNPLRWKMVASMSRGFLSRLMGSPARVDNRVEDGDLLPFSTKSVVWCTCQATPPVALDYTCPKSGLSSWGMHSSTSSAEDCIHPLQGSRSNLRWRCSPWRSCWIWTSTRFASATSPPCAMSLGRRSGNFLSDAPQLTDRARRIP